MEQRLFNRTEYLAKKRLEVLEKIKPICEVFGIEDYGYEITDTDGERLIVNNIQIGCTSNSIDAVVDELVGYIFVTRWTKRRHLGTFHTQTLNVIKQYWVK